MHTALPQQVQGQHELGINDASNRAVVVRVARDDAALDAVVRRDEGKLWPSWNTPGLILTD